MIYEQLTLHENVVCEVKTWLGTPYQHQASIKHIGCDCLGLLRGIWRCVYENEPQTIPPYSLRWNETSDVDLLQEMATTYFTSKPLSQAIEEGDLLLFKYRANLPTRHLGIAVCNDKFIHSYVGKGVVENSFSPWWQRHLSGHFGWK